MSYFKHGEELLKLLEDSRPKITYESDDERSVKLMKLFRDKPMATRNKIKTADDRYSIKESMLFMVGVALALFLLVVVLSYIERGAFL